MILPSKPTPSRASKRDLFEHEALTLTVAVAESGLRTSADLVDLGAAGYHAFLIGETLITTPEPGETLGRLIDGARPASSGVGTSVSGVEAGGS